MNYRGLIILLPAVIGLFAISRQGRLRWKVSQSRIVSGVFWFGMITWLVVGLLVLFGI